MTEATSTAGGTRTAYQALLTAAQAAERLSVTVDTLERWRRGGRGPRFLKLSGTAVRYSPDDLAAFLAASCRG